MAITTLDTLVAGLMPEVRVNKAAFTGEAAGQLHSSWFLAGTPGAGVITSSGINGTTLIGPSISGQIPFPATDGTDVIYLARMSAIQAGAIGAVTLCDRIWANNGIAVTTTTAQAITTPTWDRDAIFDGSFTGNNVQVGLEVSTATTNAGTIATCTLNYTNQAGTASRTGTLNLFPITAVAGTFVGFTLQAGDLGVRSIQGITLGTSLGAGAVSLVAYRQICTLGTPIINIAVSADGLSLGLPKMHNESVPFLLYTLTGTAALVSDVGITWAQG